MPALAFAQLQSFRHRARHWRADGRVPPAFRQVRRGLVAWNIAVLVVVLILVGVGVYLSQSRALAAEVDAQLQEQAVRELATGHPVEDLVEAQGAAAAVEPDESYAPGDSPNLFSLLLNARGRLVLRPRDVAAAGLPDLSAARPVLRGAISSTLVTVNAGPRGDGQPYRLYTVPVRQGGRIVGALQVGTSLLPRYAELRLFLFVLLLVGSAGVLLAAAGGVFLAERALAPVLLAFERQRDFVADASHELRTPLSLMRAEAELLLRATRARTMSPSAAAGSANSAASPARPDTSPGARIDTVRLTDLQEWGELAGDLLTEVDYMTRLTSHLLQLARMDRGAEPWERVPVALDVLAEETCRLARPLAADRGLDLTFSRDSAPSAHATTRGATDAGTDAVDGDEPAGADRVAAPLPAVLADAAHVRQLLLVLLDNALRFTPPSGSVRVSCAMAPGVDPRSDLVVVAVADTGPGIAPEHLPRIFDRFYRVDKARSRALGGSGLGLALAREIAQAHGGSLTVTSVVGRGSIFRLALPAARPPRSGAHPPPLEADDPTTPRQAPAQPGLDRAAPSS